MRFRYAFQKIVDLKENEKTQAEWLLADALGRMRQEEEELTKLHEAKQVLQEELHQASSARTTVSNLMLLQSYVDHMDGRIKVQREEVQQAHTFVQLKQEALSGKMLEEKLWTKAKERAFERYHSELLKREQNQLDEMATNRYLRPS
ncbi:flagellar export protein FliJ [Paenibacillus sp. YYML68]|uniref:flagellar export protein FliJ n=1 Tax=Paenibacillus sp. YYML68 TaxID=2909250 RepID=UPI002493395B|nr:flagellar export protein FliJ [Paenibacillus sp. YYML68]